MAPAAALAAQVTDQRRLRSSGGGQSWPDPLFRGRHAISLGLGTAARTSVASVTFAWLIRVLRWIVCPPVPRIDREARINHDNRRVPPLGVTPVMFCDDCGERGQAEAGITGWTGACLSS